MNINYHFDEVVSKVEFYRIMKDGTIVIDGKILPVIDMRFNLGAWNENDPKINVFGVAVEYAKMV